MRIYSMTATFGKLEHETLTLQPGLNVIQAPNEWGKSTWCAFLVAMLYGIDTRERTTQTALADKTRYAPWSGSPMSGRIDLCWNGRDITIERSTRGRIPFGVFRAYETASGLELMELTAANCGQVLLGVEKEVFTRTGFLRLTDLPVTNDEALRRRLNALVTTGDESGAADELGQKLRELKNQCRANRATGLIPKAEAQRAELENTLHQLVQLESNQEKLLQRQSQLEAHQQKLQKHLSALEYTAAREQSQKTSAARQQLQQLRAQVAQQREQCAALPAERVLLQKLAQLTQLRQQSEALEMDLRLQADVPAAPEVIPAFRGCSPEQAAEQAKKDTALYAQCQNAKGFFPWIFLGGVVLLIAGLVCLLMQLRVPALTLGALGLGCAVGGLIHWISARRRKQSALRHARRLEECYHPLPWGSWVEQAQDYARRQREYEKSMSACRKETAVLTAQKAQLHQQMETLTQGAFGAAEAQWQAALAQHRAYADDLRELRRLEQMMEALSDAQQVLLPPEPSQLSYSREETVRLLSDCAAQQRQLQKQLGHTQGQMESLGQASTLQRQLDAVNSRIAALEETYAALEIAQQTLQKASQELQRRFAPKIAARTRELFGKLTQQRYDRLILSEDLSVSTAAKDEDVLHETLWRSDGTADQLYLALRLAVAEALTPQAMLILDDALVRFDDRRLAAAMEILKEIARGRQVLLFTCQSREAKYVQEELS